MSNQSLLDDYVEVGVDTERFSAEMRRKVNRLLKKVERDVTAELAAMDPTKPRSTVYRRQRLERLNEKIKTIVGKRYKEMEGQIVKDMVKFSGVSSKMARNLVNESIGVDVFNINLTNEMLESIVSNAQLDGGLIGEWVDTKSDALQRKIRNQLRLAMGEVEAGLIKGDALAELVRRVRGTTTAPGALFFEAREAAAFVRTITAQIANDARRAAYEQNPEVLKGYRIVATLDARTTALCRGYDGLEYTMDFKPIGHTRRYPRPNGPPFHWNCRTILVPITLSWDELSKSKDLTKDQQKALNRMNQAERAAVGGPITQTKTYDEWLKLQPKARQLEVLGPGRFDLWQKKGLTMADMLDQTGRPLTLTQLARKYSRARGRG